MTFSDISVSLEKEKLRFMLIKAQLMITPRHNVFFIGHLFAILTDSHFCGRDLSTNDCFTVGQPKTISDFSSIACFRIRLSVNVQFCVLQPNIITNFRLLPLVYLVSALISLTAARSARNVFCRFNSKIQTEKN